MKTALYVYFAALLLLSLASGAAAQDEKPWFDLENCGFCKHLLDDPHLLEHCTWESHNIENGMMTVTTVDKEYLPSYRAASKKMQEVGEEMEKGNMVPMCGMCTAMGALMMKGAKWELVETEVGDVQLMTSDDPEIVKELHAFTDRNNEEMAKLEAAPAPKTE